MAARAEVSCPSLSMERFTTRASSFSSRCVRGEVTRVRSAYEQALEPNSGDFTPLTATEPALLTWYCTAVLPAR